LTTLGGLQEKQDKLEVKLVEVRRELKTVNTAVEGMQEIVKELIKNTDRAYAEVLEGVQREVTGIMEELQITQDKSYADCLKINVGLDLKEGKSQDIHQKKEMQAQVYKALEREKRSLVLMGIKE